MGEIAVTSVSVRADEHRTFRDAFNRWFVVLAPPSGAPGCFCSCGSFDSLERRHHGAIRATRSAATAITTRAAPWRTRAAGADECDVLTDDESARAKTAVHRMGDTRLTARRAGVSGGDSSV